MKKKSNAGRPSVMTTENIDKLEEGFLMGYTDREACFSAGIGETTLYDYIAKNPEYSARKAALKDNMKMLAKKVLTEAMAGGDKDIAKFVAERRDPDFVRKTENKNETKIEGTVDFKTLSDDELQKLI